MNQHDTQPLSRRDFLRALALAGGTAALSALLQACSEAGLTPFELPVSQTLQATLPDTHQPSLSPPTKTIAEPESTHSIEQNEMDTMEASQTMTPIATREKASVAFVKTRDRAEGVIRAINLLALNSFSGKQVFLKPNYNSADPAPGSTHPDVLRSIVSWLKNAGAQSIMVGDRSGMGDTRNVMEHLKVFRMADELGFDTVVFDELGPQGWTKVQPQGSHWQRGFLIAQPCLDCDAIVQLCCLKTHRYGGHFTLSLKNSVGMVAKFDPLDGYNYMNELHGSSHQRRMIAEINAAYTPAIMIMDGVEAFVNGGPASGKRVSSEVILASTDRVAIDAVGVALLRYFGTTPEVSKGPIFQQEQIARAVELGLGVRTPAQIQLMTGDNESAAYAQEIQAILMGS